MGTPPSPKLQHHWNLTIRLFDVISRTHRRWSVLPFSRGAVGVFYSSIRLSNTVLNKKTVLFRAVQFSISMKFKCQNSKLLKPQLSSIWLIDGPLSGATTLGQSGPGSDGNEGVLHIRQRSSNTRTSQSDCLVSYPGHSLVGLSYPSAEMQSGYSTAPAD